MQPYVNNSTPRPPYITFEARPMEDRQSGISGDKPMYKDVNFIIAQQIGSVNTVEKQADEWIADQYQKARVGIIPNEWPKLFEDKYEAWKKGLAAEIDGTPISHWNGISQAQLKNCHNLNIYSVEDIAALNDEAIGVLGMGSLNLKQRAQAFLDTQKGGTGEELAALRSEVHDKDEAIQRQSERIKQLVSRIEALESK